MSINQSRDHLCGPPKNEHVRSYYPSHPSALLHQYFRVFFVVIPLSDRSMSHNCLHIFSHCSRKGNKSGRVIWAASGYPHSWRLMFVPYFSENLDSTPATKMPTYTANFQSERQFFSLPEALHGLDVDTSGAGSQFPCCRYYTVLHLKLK